MKVLIAVVLGLGIQAFAGNVGRVDLLLQPPHQVEGRPAVHYKIEERLKHYRVPAVSIAVIRGGKIEWAKAWGHLETGGPEANAETVFQAASISKPVAALAALHMAQHGNFGLDGDVNAKLKSWKVPASEFVTVQGGSRLAMKI